MDALDAAGRLRRLPNSLMERKGFGSNLVRNLHESGEIWKWSTSFVQRERSFAFSVVLSACVAFGIDRAAAQEMSPAPAPGFSFDGVWPWVEPVATYSTYVVIVLLEICRYLFGHATGALLFSTIVGSTIAIMAIAKQRETSRMKETFNTISKDIWDKDVIDARNTFGQFKKDKKSTAALAEPDADLKQKQQLLNLLNTYENIAIGVRQNILDEVYLHRWMRGQLLDDWEYLSPLALILRTNLKNPAIYVEFEGLANCWRGNRAYKTGLSKKRRKKLRPSKRDVDVR